MCAAAGEHETYKWAWPVFDNDITSPHQPELFGVARVSPAGDPRSLSNMGYRLSVTHEIPLCISQHVYRRARTTVIPTLIYSRTI
jgi:hypothetical protein